MNIKLIISSIYELLTYCGSSKVLLMDCLKVLLIFCVVIKQTGSGGGGKLSKWARHIARSNRSGKGNSFKHKILRQCYSRFIQSHSKVSKLAPSATGGYIIFFAFIVYKLS